MIWNTRAGVVSVMILKAVMYIVSSKRDESLLYAVLSSAQMRSEIFHVEKAIQSGHADLRGDRELVLPLHHSGIPPDCPDAQALPSPDHEEERDVYGEAHHGHDYRRILQAVML